MLYKWDNSVCVLSRLNFLLRIISWRLLVWICSSFPFFASEYSKLYLYHNWLNDSPIEGYLDSLQFGANGIKLWTFIWTSFCVKINFHFYRINAQVCAIAGSYTKLILVLKETAKLFSSGACTVLPSHQQYMRFIFQFLISTCCHLSFDYSHLCGENDIS